VISPIIIVTSIKIGKTASPIGTIALLGEAFSDHYCLKILKTQFQTLIKALKLKKQKQPPRATKREYEPRSSACCPK